MLLIYLLELGGNFCDSLLGNLLMMLDLETLDISFTQRALGLQCLGSCYLRFWLICA